VRSFVKYLTDVNYPKDQQKINEIWDVEGRLKNGNQKFKFDLRSIKNNIKIGFFKTKADKMVFNMKDEWIIVDIEELHSYVKTKNLKNILLEDLISKLEWNIILPKK
jgi:hypothetical protein